VELLVGEGNGPLKSHCVCPHEGSCLQKVITRCRSGHGLLRKFVMSCRSRNSKGRQPWTRSLCAISALITVLSTVSRKEKWRIVGAFFVGSVPRIAEGSTICGTNVRLRERPAGYFVLRCDSQDLTLEDILRMGFATVRPTLRRMFRAMAAERAKKRRKLVLKPGYEQLTSIRLQRMPSLLLVRIRLEPGKTWKPGWLRRQACSSGSPMAGRWPLWERAK
jgi:hypothetical protein